jgi:hypothetical protein
MAMLGSADILSINSSEAIVGLVKQVEKVCPELRYFPASTVTKDKFTTLVRTALPSAGFRAPGTGRTLDSSTLDTKTVECKYLDASYAVDVAAAKKSDWGIGKTLAIEAMAHLEAAFYALAQQIYYGETSDSNGGFPGVASLLDDSDDSMVVDAAGTTETTGSSVFAFRYGEQDTCLVWGNDGRIEEGPVSKVMMDDGTGKKYFAFAQDIAGNCGMQLHNSTAIGRICNLTEDSDKGLTDDLLYKLLAKFPAGKGPDALFLSKRSLYQLRNSRTATSPTGAPAPIPRTVEGIPLVVTDAISDTETLLTAGA